MSSGWAHVWRRGRRAFETTEAARCDPGQHLALASLPLVSDAGDPAGEILRRGLHLHTEGLNGNEACERMMRRRRRRGELRTRGVWAVGFAAAAAAAVLIGRARAPREETSGPLVAALPEVWRPSAPASPRSDLPEVSSGEHRADAAREGTIGPRRIAPRALRQTGPSRRAASASSNGRTLAEEVTNEWCRAEAELGRTAEAIRCYRVVARGGGFAGEMALHEVVRLRANDLDDPQGALEAIGEYRRQFSDGALQSEMRLARVRVLYGLGRSADALQESMSMLEAADGQRFAPELRLLRGRIFADRLGDCERAQSEFRAVAGDPSSTGDEAEFRRAVCLERLGRIAHARDAYSTYLQRPQAARAAEAQARLRTLPVPR